MSAVALIMLVTSGACSGSSDQNGDDSDDDEVVEDLSDGAVAQVTDLRDYELVEVIAEWSTAQAADLGTLVSSSDVVFVGTVVKRTGQRDEPSGLASSGGSPLAGKPEAEPPAGFPVSSFDVEVTESIVGNLGAGDVIVIEQLGGFVTDDNDERSLLVLEGDVPLEPGVSYLMFATIKPNGTYTSAPYARMQILDNYISTTETWEDLPAIAQLSGLRVDQAIEEIGDAR